MTCQKCGAPVKRDVGVCEVCGTSVSKHKTKRGKNARVPIAIVAAALVVVVGATTVTGYLTATNRHSTAPAPVPTVQSTPKPSKPFSSPYSVYAENGAMMLLDTQTAMPYPITSSMQNAVGKAADVVFSKDGSHMFYAENAQTVSDGEGRETDYFTLYYCATEQIDAVPQKLAEDVSAYTVNAAGTAVLYVDTDGTLYRHDLTEKVRVGDLKTESGQSAASAYLSANGQTVMYINEEGRLYIKKGESDTLLVDEHVTQVYSNDAAFSTVYYAKSGSGINGLYKKKDGYQSEKILDGNVARIVPSGERFYALVDAAPVSVYDLMEDDLSHDMPAQPVLPVRESYPTDEAFAAAMAQYEKDAAALAQAERLAIVRARLRSETISLYTLWHYDGKKTVQVNDWVETVAPRIVNGRLVYSRADHTAIKEKPRLSRVQDADAVKAQLREALSVQWFAAKAEKTAAFKDGICYPLYSEDGTTMVYTTALNDGTYALYQASLLGGKISATEHIATTSSPVTDGHLLDDGTYMRRDGERVYAGGELVIEGLHSIVDIDEQTLTMLYYTNRDDKDQCATLMLYTVGEEPVRIADDVADAQLRADGAVVFLADCDRERTHGVLKLYKDEEITVISEQVTALVDNGLSSDGVGTYGYAQMIIE